MISVQQEEALISVRYAWRPFWLWRNVSTTVIKFLKAPIVGTRVEENKDVKANFTMRFVADRINIRIFFTAYDIQHCLGKIHGSIKYVIYAIFALLELQIYRQLLENFHQSNLAQQIKMWKGIWPHWVLIFSSCISFLSIRGLYSGRRDSTAQPDISYTVPRGVPRGVVWHRRWGNQDETF